MPYSAPSHPRSFDTFPDPAAFPELGPTGPPNLSGSVPNMGGLSQMVERTASDMEVGAWLSVADLYKTCFVSRGSLAPAGAACSVPGWCIWSAFPHTPNPPLPHCPTPGAQLMRHNSNPALMPGSPAGPPPAVDTSSPFFGRNPFEAPFGELAPKLPKVAPRRAPPPPPGPPMCSLSNQ